jgi:phosphatidate cytidylyltransferase
MLRVRIVTALVLFAGFVAAFYFLTPAQFAWLLLAVVALAAFEWGRLCLRNHTLGAIVYAGIVVFIALWARSKVSWAQPIVFLGAAFWCASPMILRLWSRRDSVPRTALLVGLVVLLPAFFSLAALRSMAGASGGFLWVLLIVVWAADSGAYFTGRAIGRRKLAPRISPGKTWEGAAGGLVSAALLGYLATRLVPQAENLPGLAWVAVCAAVAAFSVLGDLTESLFKRMAGVKDSGALLPGHGGALDRVDGILAAAPVFTALLWLLHASPVTTG